MKIILTKDEVAEAVAAHLKGQLGIEAKADEITFRDSYRTEFVTWETKVVTNGE